ncbi:ALG3 protein [Cooperia oncophora]
MSLKDNLLRLLFTVNDTGFILMSAAVFLVDAVITFFIIQKVPYTEIDWSTYMQQVECYTVKQIRNYSEIGGDTGPVVYPAGHLWTYGVLHALTSGGKDIRTAQYIFMCLYLLNLLAVLRLYYKSNKVFIGLPFLIHDPVSYIRRSFDLGRVFCSMMTVELAPFCLKSFHFVILHLQIGARRLKQRSTAKHNSDFSDLFISPTSLDPTIISSSGFVIVWVSYVVQILRRCADLAHRGVSWHQNKIRKTLFALFSANLIGITFARSLHYQFYSWYYHQLPFLLFWNSHRAQDDKQPLVVPWISIIIK